VNEFNMNISIKRASADAAPSKASAPAAPKAAGAK
jgi:hypothetical protein